MRQTHIAVFDGIGVDVIQADLQVTFAANASVVKTKPDAATSGIIFSIPPCRSAVVQTSDNLPKFLQVGFY